MISGQKSTVVQRLWKEIEARTQQVHAQEKEILTERQRQIQSRKPL